MTRSDITPAAPLPGDDIGPDLTPLTLDQISVDYAPYGVKVAALGEDGDLGWVAFTHDTRRALAALNSAAREQGRVAEILLGDPRWWVVIDRCGCGETCPHAADSDGYTEHDDCRFYGLAPCKQEAFSWLGLYCTEGTPGALAVIEAEVEWR